MNPHLFLPSGFSFVYLAQDGSGNLYALKKVRCTLGTEEAKVAEREVEVYRLFEHDNIIRMLVSFKKCDVTDYSRIVLRIRIQLRYKSLMAVLPFTFSCPITRYTFKKGRRGKLGSCTRLFLCPCVARQSARRHQSKQPAQDPIY